MSMAELGRLTAQDGAKGSYTLDPDAETLIVENGLTAVIYGAYGREPSATEWDFAVPGGALFTLPILGGQARLYVLVDYPGAVPAGDVQAILWTTGCKWPPSVGPIA